MVSQNTGDPNGNSIPQKWAQENYKSNYHIGSERIRSVDNKPDANRKNLQGYTFGGITNIRATPMYTNLRPNKFKIDAEYNRLVKITQLSLCELVGL